MIIDPSRIMCGTSVSRMSEYLSLCKIECLVRKVEVSTPSRHVDQPSKVGTAGTMAKRSRSAKPQITLRVDYTQKMGSRERTLRVKSELRNQLKIEIQSLSEAGTVILQQDGKEFERLPLYTVISKADNFAKLSAKNGSSVLFLTNKIIG